MYQREEVFIYCQHHFNLSRFKDILEIDVLSWFLDPFKMDKMEDDSSTFDDSSNIEN